MLPKVSDPRPISQTVAYLPWALEPLHVFLVIHLLTRHSLMHARKHVENAITVLLLTAIMRQLYLRVQSTFLARESERSQSPFPPLIPPFLCPP